MNRIRQHPGNDWFVFGSGSLAASFMRQGLIDEYRLLLNPVVLGQGKPMFQGLERPLKLTLLNTRQFANGNVLLVYQPEQQGDRPYV